MWCDDEKGVDTRFTTCKQRICKLLQSLAKAQCIQNLMMYVKSSPMVHNPDERWIVKGNYFTCADRGPDYVKLSIHAILERVLAMPSGWIVCLQFWPRGLHLWILSENLLIFLEEFPLENFSFGNVMYLSCSMGK